MYINTHIFPKHPSQLPTNTQTPLMKAKFNVERAFATYRMYLCAAHHFYYIRQQNRFVIKFVS